MPQGIAVRIGPAPSRFYAGSDIYQLFPSLGQFEGQDDHVVVAITPCAIDHGLRETTVFRCMPDGSIPPHLGLDYGAEALAKSQRIVGRYDAHAALANLSGAGYLVVDAESLAPLKALALKRAQAFAQEKLSLNRAHARAYANDNWGLFASEHLVESGIHDPPSRSTNHVFGANLLLA